ncbi:hypothetical protein D6B98_37985 [Bradyrhizobium sp. LVM 105]|uniref:Uncharacterized protein n=1 Tax=Bradyrhizobium frederickii TaxID=2560054 RepID=A0A4Y9NMM9_9BRAD|nr:hypothetical protein D6B98_37985 [Bradyrhizobium sp. LVM 105]TFV29546.1 hypothetical protein E4K66_37305 [Bradyrhizobium frederickii]TFV68073.1 hypothetical protein E4K64_37425 [Bradyrhizobium frederickii]
MRVILSPIFAIHAIAASSASCHRSPIWTPLPVDAAYTGALAATGVRISMDGRGRWMDNVFIERSCRLS